MDDNRRQEEELWDRSSREESEKNYVLGGTMANPWNNAKNPNWRNYIIKDGFRREKINDLRGSMRKILWKTVTIIRSS